MSITTIAGVSSKLQPPVEFSKQPNNTAALSFINSFYAVSLPGAAATPSPGLAGAALTTYAGQLPFSNPVSGNTYIGKLIVTASLPANFFLLDRLWHNSGLVVTTTTAQTINSVAWPARDKTGTTNGEDILIGLESAALTGNAAAVTNTTMSYTNSAGTAGRTGIITATATGAQMKAGYFVPFELDAGDTGVQSIQTITLGTSYVSGTLIAVAYRVLAKIDIITPGIPYSLDPVTSGFVRLYDNTVPYMAMLPPTSSTVNYSGSLVYAQG